MKRVFVFLILITQPVFAYYTETIPNQCGVIGNDLCAIFEINTYTCESGQFLPADALGCVSCPADYTCNGGTFDYNATISQGIDPKRQITTNVSNACSSNFGHELNAVFEPNQYTCQPGYYLPANIDECTICPNDNYCVGGTYTFNETTPQGIEPCPDAHPFAPVGMWTQSQCGRKLHVGDDVLYLHQVPATPTARRLYVRFNDVVYSANATEVAIAPTTMSEYAKRALHVIIDGVEYLIHDDSAK